MNFLLAIRNLLLLAACIAGSVAFAGAQETKGRTGLDQPEKLDPKKADESKPKAKVDFYTVDHYDEKRDPAKDLEETIKRATKEKKRILVQVGGDWCIWCKRMSAYMETTPSVTKAVSDGYLVMKVTYTNEQKNQPFLSKYPAIKGYPHVFVLDSDGKLLHSQDTDKLEKDKGYDEDAFLKFLADWRAKK